MKNEKWLSRTLRDKCSEQGLLTFWSFEFAGGQGIPDLYCVAKDRSGWQALPMWIELKVVNSERQKIPFRPGQVQWITSHRSAGGRLLVVVFNNQDQDLWIIPDRNINANTQNWPLMKFSELGGTVVVGALSSANFWPRVAQALRDRA